MTSVRTKRPPTKRKRRKKAKVGRKLKLTPEVRAGLLRAAELGAPIREAAGAVGIHKATYCRWMAEGDAAKKGPFRELCDQVEGARSRFMIRQLERLDALGGQGNAQVIMWSLERVFPETFGRVDRSKVELDAKVERTTGPDELDLLIEQLAARQAKTAEPSDE